MGVFFIKIHPQHPTTKICLPHPQKYAKIAPTIQHKGTLNDHKSEILAQFDDIIAQGDLNQVVPFLTAHKDGNVSELKKHLNKARHHYLDWHEYEGILGDDNHQRIIFCFALGLLSASDFNSRWLNCSSEVLNCMCDAWV